MLSTLFFKLNRTNDVEYGNNQTGQDRNNLSACSAGSEENVTDQSNSGNDDAENHQALRSGRIVHLGLMDSDCPYVVPMHYGLEIENRAWILYLHSASSGHKIDLIRNNPVCFAEIDCDMELISGGDNACSYGAAFSSVMGKGTVEVLEKPEEKIHGLQVLMEHQTGRGFEIAPSAAEHVCVLKVTLPHITGKKRRKPFEG